MIAIWCYNQKIIALLFYCLDNDNYLYYFALKVLSIKY